MWLRIRLLIFIRVTAERDNLMWLYGWSLSYTWPPGNLLSRYMFCKERVLFFLGLVSYLRFETLNGSWVFPLIKQIICAVSMTNEKSALYNLSGHRFFLFIYFFLHFLRVSAKSIVAKIWLPKKIVFHLVFGACVCVFIHFHREGFFRLQDVWDILEGTDQRCYVVSIICCADAKFLHLGIWKYHISPPKTKTPVLTNWRENDMIYVDPRKDDILI